MTAPRCRSPPWRGTGTPPGTGPRGPRSRTGGHGRPGSPGGPRVGGGDPAGGGRTGRQRGGPRVGASRPGRPRRRRDARGRRHRRGRGTFGSGAQVSNPARVPHLVTDSAWLWGAPSPRPRAAGWCCPVPGRRCSACYCRLRGPAAEDGARRGPGRTDGVEEIPSGARDDVPADVSGATGHDPGLRHALMLARSGQPMVRRR